LYDGLTYFHHLGSKAKIQSSFIIAKELIQRYGTLSFQQESQARLLLSEIRVIWVTLVTINSKLLMTLFLSETLKLNHPDHLRPSNAKF
jgi:hypothetical protein